MHTILIPKTLALVLSLAVVVTALPALAGDASSADETFERFKGLEGHWSGTSKNGKTVNLRYELAGDGSSVMEHFSAGEDHDMLTVYHLDGDSMMLTHYCAAGNQPRMRATDLDDPKKVAFDFVDVTNLSSPDEGHMRRAVFEFVDGDHMKSSWTWFENGEAVFTEEIDVERVAAK